MRANAATWCIFFMVLAFVGYASVARAEPWPKEVPACDAGAGAAIGVPDQALVKAVPQAIDDNSFGRQAGRGKLKIVVCGNLVDLDADKMPDVLIKATYTYKDEFDGVDGSAWFVLKRTGEGYLLVDRLGITSPWEEGGYTIGVWAAVNSPDDFVIVQHDMSSDGSHSGKVYRLPSGKLVKLGEFDAADFDETTLDCPDMGNCPHDTKVTFSDPRNGPFLVKSTGHYVNDYEGCSCITYEDTYVIRNGVLVKTK